MSIFNQVILAGRKINDDMGKYIAEQAVKQLIAAGKTVKGAKLLVAGITFKENVSDIRNSKVIDIINELKEYGVEVSVCDPLADAEAVKHEYGLELVAYSPALKLDAVILAVSHAAFKKQLSVEALKKHLSSNGTKGVVVDVKGLYEPSAFSGTGLLYWRL